MVELKNSYILKAQENQNPLFQNLIEEYKKGKPRFEKLNTNKTFLFNFPEFIDWSISDPEETL